MAKVSLTELRALKKDITVALNQSKRHHSKLIDIYSKLDSLIKKTEIKKPTNKDSVYVLDELFGVSDEKK